MSNTSKGDHMAALSLLVLGLCSNATHQVSALLSPRLIPQLAHCAQVHGTVLAVHAVGHHTPFDRLHTRRESEDFLHMSCLPECYSERHVLDIRHLEVPAETSPHHEVLKCSKLLVYPSVTVVAVVDVEQIASVDRRRGMGMQEPHNVLNEVLLFLRFREGVIGCRSLAVELYHVYISMIVVLTKC